MAQIETKYISGGDYFFEIKIGDLRIGEIVKHASGGWSGIVHHPIITSDSCQHKTFSERSEAEDFVYDAAWVWAMAIAAKCENRILSKLN